MVHLLNQKWLQEIEHRKLRFRYTHQVCEVLMALDSDVLREHLIGQGKVDTAMQSGSLHALMPAVAAALGDGNLLLSHTASHTDLSIASCKHFPNALDAAVASGSTEILSVILAYLKANVKGKPQADSWDEMRGAARSVGQALRVAIRLHKTDAANMIFNWLFKNRVFGGSMSKFFGEKLIKDCMRHGNTELIYGACAYNSRGAYGTHQYGRLGKLPLPASQEFFLFKYGHPSVLRILIESGSFDPNNSRSIYPPLQQALDMRRLKLMRVLLTNGADLNVTVKYKREKSILPHAVA